MMKPILFALISLFSISELSAQDNPVINSWLLNKSNIKGRYYAKGNSTPIDMTDLANVQKVQYSTDWAYITATGVPAYITGPFLDGNPSITTNQNAIFKFPLNPTKNTGTPSPTTLGNIGIFINGVALFDYRDGVSWNNAQGKLAGGPTGGQGDGVWNRDAVVAERDGFDCAKGHPAMGNYHHHQNPSAFRLDLSVVSNVCDLYTADGLYVIDSTKHAPLIGFAYDGYPIYGAYGYKNADGTGGIVRIKSGYSLRSITNRTHYANGNDVTDGPDVNSTYPLGVFREDYEFISSADEDVLDAHNGRFCVTPEYPDGTYAYFCTVDENWNSAYPYAVGPTFYGNIQASKVNSITETVTEYTGNANAVEKTLLDEDILIYPNPAANLVAVQLSQAQQENYRVELYDMLGNKVQDAMIWQGSTIAHFDTRALYAGDYVVRIILENQIITKKLNIIH